MAENSYPKGLIIPNAEVESESSMKEAHSKFACGPNSVIIGRYHKGDEHGITTYRESTLFRLEGGDVEIETTKHEWSDWFKESDGIYFVATDNRVLTGCQHKGHGNRETRYQTAKVLVNGREAIIKNEEEVIIPKESDGVWAECCSKVMIGRYHKGDENKDTKYKFGALYLE